MIRKAVLIAALFVAAGSAGAQRTLVNPYPATGALDITGSNTASRALRAMQNYATPSAVDAVAQQLQQALARGLIETVELERNPRGGGDVAADELAASPATANALLLAGSGLGGGHVLQTLRGLQPVAGVARAPLVLVSNGEGGAVSMTDMLQQARRRGMPTPIGTPGERSVGHALAGLLRAQWPHGLAPVAYNGGNGALRGLLSGQVTLSLLPLPAVMPFATGDRFRVLAIASAVRHQRLPAIPTLRESGLALTAAGGWYGLFAAPRAPAAHLQRLQAAVESAWREAETQKHLLVLGFVPDFENATALRRLVAAPPETALSADLPPAASLR